jgi:heme-degrading monooxygenase HmoA
MYARLTMLKADPSNRPALERATKDQLLPLFRAQPGFKNLMVLADDASGEYAGLSFWESREAAEAASQVVNPVVREAIAGLAQGTLTPHLFDVYEPGA